jgi:signal peptidase II
MRARLAWIRALAVLLVVFVLDQLTKNAVNNSIAVGQRHHFLPGLELVDVHNRNYVLGLGFIDSQLRLIVGVAGLTLILTCVLVIYSLRHSTHPLIQRHSAHPLIWLPTGLLLGGALANVIDRVSEGSVTDFIEVSASRTVFNLADVAVMSGTLMMLYLTKRKLPSSKHRRRRKDPAVESGGVIPQEGT